MTGTRAPESPDPPAPADSWDRLVSAALVGTSRRPVPDTPDLPDLPGAEGAGALLDRAALAAVRRVAGYVPATGTAPLAPDTEDERPEVGRAATDRLERVLTERIELLPEWLELVAARGRRAAHSSVPALLDQGVRDSRLRPALATAIGTRGHWMARFNPSWSYMLAESAPGDRFGERDWERGTPGERRRALAALRAADPGRARALLAAAWPGLAKAELRRRLLETLATGLGPADEEFLEGALDDRSANVRGCALSLLTRLTGGAHAERLRGCVRRSASLDADGILRMDPAGTDDPAVRRDLALAASDGRSESANQRQERMWALVTHTPLDAWPGLLGTDPAGVLTAARKGPGGYGRNNRLFGALVNAVVVQQDAEWAEAALGTIGVQTMRHPNTGELFQLANLLGLLPLRERCGLVSGVLDDAAPLVRWGELLHAVRGPWTPELGERVVGRLLTKGRKHDHHGYRELCEAAAAHMAPEYVAELPGEPPIDTSADAYLQLRDTLRFRLDMHREL
ncbi:MULTISPECIES: DUF5691 domain-containing protein [unclassified Nocardiopsis]|uniref:DUF5691 domain-containing protein n=1 Tax=unclassified Nocardiopsis TaxID=2649073 RepID=UPI000A7197E7|nr:DUF5691 domain-containing protein [Nocardiopsis sp. TSRI0078]